MTVDRDCFITETEREYRWPYPIPLEERPPPPALVTKPKNLYVTKTKPCQCFAHQSQPHPSIQYNSLLEKEKNLCQELKDIRLEIESMSRDITEDSKEQVLTSYQIDFDAREENVDPEEGLKDTSEFKKVAFGEFESKVCPPVHFKETTNLIDDWFSPKTGRTEYQDTISKMGLSLLQNRQQYVEPLPSSKKRQGETTFY